MIRDDLTAFEWRVMGRSLSNKPLDVLKIDDRTVLNGIFWMLWLGFP